MLQINTAKKGDSIKVHIVSTNDEGFAGESVWAEELGNNTARINNLPFFVTDCGLNDIVRYEIEDGIREFKEVITKVTNSWGVTWEPTNKDNREQSTEEWHQIARHLKSNDVDYESVMVGMFVIALPVDQEEENIIWIKALKYSSPIELTLHFGEDDEENDI